MPTPLPTILFLAGGFADPSCFDEFSAIFQSHGYPTVYATVPSLNSSAARTATTSLDAQHVREKFLRPLLDSGKDVIIVAHSYGGVVGGAAAFGLGKRVASEEGGVVGFLCVPAVLTAEGETLLDVLGGRWPEWLLVDYPSDGLCQIPHDMVMDILYNDVSPDSPRKAELQARMLPHSIVALSTPSGPPAWAEAMFDGRRGYIRTPGDQTNPVVLQDGWVKNSGVEWDVETLEAGHCPFISQPEQLSELCLGYFKKWAL